MQLVSKLTLRSLNPFIGSALPSPFFLERVPIQFGTLFLFKSITNLGCTRFVCKQAFTRSFARALWESRSSPLFLEEFFQKSSSFFVLCRSLRWWHATNLTAPLPEGRACIAQLSSYVGAHRCVRPTIAREFHSGRHMCAPKTQAMKNGQTHRSAPTLFALRCLCSSPPSLRFACATSSSQRGDVLYIC